MPPDRPLAGLSQRGLLLPTRRHLDLVDELESDLEGMQLELQSSGISPLRARQAALEWLVPNRESLAQLEDQHARPHREFGWAARCLTAVAAIGVGGGLWFAGLVSFGPSSSSPSTWVQVAITLLLGANLTGTAWHLWIRRSDTAAARHRSLVRHFGLVTIAVTLGGLGTCWEAYYSLGTVLAQQGSPVEVWGVLGESLSHATLGLGAAIFGLLGWLALTPRLIGDEAIERRIAMAFIRPALALVPSAKSPIHPPDSST